MRDAEVKARWTGVENPTTGARRELGEHAHEPRTCTIWDLAAPKDGQEVPAEMVEDFNAYLSPFAAPVTAGERTLCFHCGEPLTGSLVDAFIGRAGFQWGIAHGEGFCGCCRWPARLYHFIKDRHGGDLATIRHIPLSYLPTPQQSDPEIRGGSNE